MSQPDVHGTHDARFAAVKQAFAENFAQRNEIGAAVAVLLDGKPVVDLWAGHADPERTRPWKEDTIANVFSTTKGVAATVALRLADSGELDLDQPVARYWPEFAANGKGEIPVRMIFNHQAGIPALRAPVAHETLWDHDAMGALFAAEEPWWRPGSTHGYHALSIGWLLGGLVQRIRGKSLGRVFQEEIARPLGLDFHIGLPASEHGRTANLTNLPAEPAPGEPSLASLIMADLEAMPAKTFANPSNMLAPGTVNTKAWRSAELPGANGHGSARALAKLYGALARGGELDGVRVLSQATIDRARSEESFGRDEVLTITTRFGLGYMLPHEIFRFGSTDRSFGHPGAGGSIAFADPEARIGFAYVMNRTGPHLLMDPRPRALIDAVYASAR